MSALDALSVSASEIPWLSVAQMAEADELATLATAGLDAGHPFASGRIVRILHA